MDKEQRRLAHRLFNGRMGNLEVERMIKTKEFRYGMKVARESIATAFEKLDVSEDQNDA